MVGTSADDPRAIRVERHSKDRDSMPLVKLSAITAGEGFVVTRNKDGQELVVLSAITGGDSTVATFNGRGRELWRSPSR